MPPFSNALYYPTIDIHNLEWLKTAVLFWDSISTIVPATIENPYMNYDTQFLYQEGFLHPLRVNPNDDAVIGIEADFLALLSSPEAIQDFFFESDGAHARIHRSKMSYELEDTIQRIQRHPMHIEKVSRDIQDRIERMRNGDYYYVNSTFASLYMTALANKLCENHVLAMVTDKAPFFTAGNTIKYGNTSCLFSLGWHQRMDFHPGQQGEFAQGILLNFIIQGLSISPDTTLDELMQFRIRHRDELGRFKVELANLTRTIGETDMSIDNVQHRIEDIYKNQFLPAYHDFTAALSGFNIRYFMDAFVKVASITSSATGIPTLLMDLPVEQALLAGMGISVIASAIKYNVDKREKLHNNPYSYLLSLKREF